MRQQIWTLIIKELLAVWQDKKSRALLILPPLIQLFVFSFAATLDVQNISLGVLNKDQGKYSHEFVQRFVGAPVFSKVGKLTNESHMRKAVNSKKVDAVLHIDEQFSRDLLADRPAKVQLILDGRKSNSAQIIMGYAQEIRDQFQFDLSQEFNDSLSSTVIVQRSWYNPNLIYQWFTVPGLIGVLLMLMGLLITALSVAREREVGTYEQLLVSPLSPIDILIGKMVPGIIIGILEGTIIFLAAIVVFKIPFTGSIWQLYFCIFIFICSMIGIGLFISSVSKTQQQAILGVFAFMVPAVALSGFATPVENMPEWLQTATLVNPLRYFLVLIRGIFLKQLPFSLILRYVYPMVIIACFTMGSAAWFFRKNLE